MLDFGLFLFKPTQQADSKGDENAEQSAKKEDEPSDARNGPCGEGEHQGALKPQPESPTLRMAYLHPPERDA